MTGRARVVVVAGLVAALLVALGVLVGWLVREVSRGNLLALLWLLPFPVAAWLIWTSHADGKDE